MSGFRSAYDTARRRMCDSLVQAGMLKNRRVEAAFRSVPREAFVPPAAPADVYADTTIPVAGLSGQWLTTSSQPGMMAIMLEQLDVQPGHRVLEIGSGTGYNTAMLACLAGPEGRVDSVEVEPEAADAATHALQDAGCSAHVHAADGADGWPDAAPYDRILSTVAIWDLPGPWEQQAAPGARIVAPFTLVGAEYSLALEREGDAWVSRSVAPCAFVRFKGRMAHPDIHMVFGEADHPALILRSEPGQMPPRASVASWLSKGTGDAVVGIDQREDWESFPLWILAEHGPRRTVRAVSGGAGLGWTGPAVGLWDDEGMSLLTVSGRLVRFGDGSTEALQDMVNRWATHARATENYRLRLTTGAEPPGPGTLPRWTHTLHVEHTAG